VDEERGVLRGSEPLIDLVDGGGVLDVRGARHHDVIAAVAQVRGELVERRFGDRFVRAAERPDGAKGDRLEVPVLLRLLEGVIKDHFSAHKLAVVAIRGGGELHDRLARETAVEVRPGVGRDVMGLV
jgi:hypothetical protein